MADLENLYARLEQEEIDEEPLEEGEEFDPREPDEGGPAVAEEAWAPPPAAPRGGRGFAFERAPLGAAVGGYGSIYDRPNGSGYPPLWPRFKDYEYGTTTLLVQHRNESGLFVNLGSVQGDATLLDLVAKYRKPGSYQLTPVDTQGETLSRQPVVVHIPKEHDAFRDLAAEMGRPGGAVMGAVSGGGGNDVALQALVQGLQGERRERSFYQGQLVGAERRAAQAGVQAEQAIRAEMAALAEERVQAERRLAELQLQLIEKSQVVAQTQQEMLMTEQKGAFAAALGATKSATETVVSILKDRATQAENLADKQVAAVVSQGTQMQGLFSAVLQSQMAASQQAVELERIRLQNERIQLEAAAAERRARLEAEEEDRRRRRAEEDEERRIRREEREERERIEEADRRRRAQEREERELRLEEQERARAADEDAWRRRLREQRLEEERERERLSRNNPSDPLQMIERAAAIATALSGLVPVFQRVIKPFTGDQAEAAPPASSGIADVVKEGLALIPSLLSARTQQMQLALAAQGIGVPMIAQDDDDGDEDDEDDEDEAALGRPQPVEIVQPPRGGLQVGGVPPAPAPGPVRPTAPAPAFPVQRAVRQLIARIVSEVSRLPPPRAVEQVQPLVVAAVMENPADFLAFCSWKGLGAALAEARPAADVQAAILHAVATYTGPGAQFLKEIPA